jgi:hypothetical protein
MPDFPVEDLNITPGEFVDACNQSEIDDLLTELEGHQSFRERYFGNDDKDDGPRAYSHSVFNQNLFALKKAWYQVEKEDAEIIAILAKKYGVV